MFLLISCRFISCCISIFLVFCARRRPKSKQNKRTKIYNKETGKFHSQSHFMNFLAGGFAHLFQGTVALVFVHNLGGVWGFLLCSSKELYFLCLPDN